MPPRAPSARLALIAPAVWTIYLLLPAPNWGPLDGFPLGPFGTAAIAIIWLAHFSWRPRWQASLPIALVILKLVIGSLGFSDRGLAASYFANPTLAPPAARRDVDRRLDFRPGFGRDLSLSFLAGDSAPFSVSWSGYLRVPHDEAVNVFLEGRDVSASVAIDGLEVVALRPGATFSRTPVTLTAGWRQIAVTLSSAGKGRVFYSGVVDAAGTARSFGDDWVYRRHLTGWRVGLDRVAGPIGWLLDVGALGYLAIALGLAWVRRDLISADGVTLSLIGVGVALIVAVVPHGIGGDGRVRFDGLADLLARGHIPAIAYSLTGPLFSAPLFYLGALAFGPEWWCARFNSIVFAVGLVMLDWLLRDHVERPVRWTFFLLLVSASMFAPQARSYDAEMFTTMCAAAGIAALTGGRAGLGWTLLVLGTVNTPAALVSLTLVAAWHAWTTKRVRHLVPVAAAAALIVLESWIRRGGPFVTGYERNGGFPTVMPYSGLPGFSYPLLFGVLAILLSFGKGLLFYTPGLIVPIDRSAGVVSDRLRACYRLWIVFLAGLVLVYAKWWAWYGGWTWGPRFFLFASVPASLAIAVKLRQAERQRMAWLLALAAVIALSTWVAIDGVVFDQVNAAACLQNDYAQEFLCWYVPEFSALWRPFVAPRALAAREFTFPAFAVAAFAWLSAPLVARAVAIVRALDVAAMRSAVRSFRF